MFYVVTATTLSQSATNKLIKQRTISAFKEIVAVVNPSDVVDELFQSQVLSAHKVKLISQLPTHVDQCRQLMFYLLSSRHPRAFVVFRQSLLKDYQWLVDRIDNEQCQPVRTSNTHVATDGFDEVDSGGEY